MAHYVFKFVMIAAYLKINNGYVKQCKVSLSTIKVVAKCPSTEREVMEAIQRKNCTAISNTCPSFEYHCVRNWNSTALYEVCAPSFYIVGFVCSEYNEAAMSIRATTISCANFTHSCPFKYNSTEQFKYPECFDDITTEPKRKRPDAERNSSTGSIVGVIYGVVCCTLCVICIIFIKKKMKKEDKTFKAAISSNCVCCQTEDVSRTTPEQNPMIPVTSGGQSGTVQATPHGGSGTQQPISDGENGREQTISNEESGTEQAVSDGESGTQQAISNKERGTQQAISNGESGTQRKVFNYDSTENITATQQEISDRQIDEHVALINTQVTAKEESGQINIPVSSDKFSFRSVMHQENIKRGTDTPQEYQDRPLDAKGESQDKNTATKEKFDPPKKTLPRVGKTKKEFRREAVSAEAILVEGEGAVNSIIDEMDTGTGIMAFDEGATPRDLAIEQFNQLDTPENKQLIQELKAKEKALNILEENLRRENEELRREFRRENEELRREFRRENEELRREFRRENEELRREFRLEHRNKYGELERQFNECNNRVLNIWNHFINSQFQDINEQKDNVT